MTEVYVDGIRYVPAREISGSFDDVRTALLDTYWGENYRGTNPDYAEQGLFVLVRDDSDLGGEPFGEFMDNIVAKLANKSST